MERCQAAIAEDGVFDICGQTGMVVIQQDAHYGEPEGVTLCRDHRRQMRTKGYVGYLLPGDTARVWLLHESALYSPPDTLAGKFGDALPEPALP